MPFGIINPMNSFDPPPGTRYATQELADAKARELLQNSPGQTVSVVQILKDYTAKVTISVKDPAEVPVPEPEPDPNAPE